MKINKPVLAVNNDKSGETPESVLSKAEEIDDVSKFTLPAQAEPINILIVDDEPRNLAVLEAVLNDPSYRLIRAESAEQALLALLAREL